MSRILQGTEPRPSTTAQYPSVHSIVNAAKEALLPEMVMYINRSLNQSFAGVVNLLAPSQVYSQGTQLAPAVQHVAHPYLLAQLRKFMGGDPLLGFLNASQAEVTQLMYEGRRHVLYISGTGKSLLLCASGSILIAV